MDEKRLHTRKFQLKGIGEKHEMQIASKKGLLEKQQSVPHTCDILPFKKIFFQNLTDAFFKYLLSILSSFILVLWSFNFYFKITWPPPTKLPAARPPAPHQNKHFWSPQQRLFWNFYPPPPSWKGGGGRGACPVIRHVSLRILQALNVFHSLVKAKFL